MLFAMTEREFYDRFGDYPLLILWVAIWVAILVAKNPDPFMEAATRAFGAIRRLFKNNAGK